VSISRRIEWTRNIALLTAREKTICGKFAKTKMSKINQKRFTTKSAPFAASSLWLIEVIGFIVLLSVKAELAIRKRLKCEKKNGCMVSCMKKPALRAAKNLRPPDRTRRTAAIAVPIV
jgi:hypothetical protein